MADTEEDSVLLERSARLTRGQRMTKLLDEEIEQDELFWNQDALMEEENDANYEEEPEAADEFDSDFDDDEPDPDDEAENEPEIRVPIKKRLIFPGKPVTKKKNKKKVLSKLDKGPKIEKSSEKSTPSEHQDAPDELEGERVVRKSTRTSVIVRQAERDAIRAALQASMKPIKRKKEGEEKRMTQEEMLLEAAQTEIMNLRNLERVLAREEEVKKRAIVHKAVYNGPQIRFTSRDGKSYLEFSKGLPFQSEICTASVPCIATQRQDYLMRHKKLSNFLQEESDKKKQAKMDLGSLFDSVSDQGFSCKRRRSGAGTMNKPSDLRLGARFRSIPALEILDQD
uniref:SWR1 complex subunit 2 isoform X2 n=1 Tax=Elaeis guineensis var. tenera TaxID=51953 RepID=A0A6I9SQD7_ELAGV|nr:SWR1 complex subunit 2 isoform X2 [Elaeis guineensis]